MSERLLVSADRDVLQQQLDHHEVTLYLGFLISYNFKKTLFTWGPPLWSSGQSSCLQIRGSRVRLPALQKKKRRRKVVGLDRGPLSLMSTTEELLGRNSSCSGLESQEYGYRDSSR
jgi:hypothetical protein